MFVCCCSISLIPDLKQVQRTISLVCILYRIHYNYYNISISTISKIIKIDLYTYHYPTIFRSPSIHCQQLLSSIFPANKHKSTWKMTIIGRCTLQGTNISPKNGILKMIFLFPKVGYVNSLEGTFLKRGI